MSTYYEKIASSRMFFSEPCEIFESSYSAERLFAPDSWKGLLMESVVVFFKNLRFLEGTCRSKGEGVF